MIAEGVRELYPESVVERAVAGHFDLNISLTVLDIAHLTPGVVDSFFVVLRMLSQTNPSKQAA